jgi:hypothetical protein
MRRFIIYHRRGRNRWRQLQPGRHDDLCGRPEIDRAICYLRDDSIVAGIAVRLGDDLFNLMTAAASDCYEFTFPEG